MGSITLNAIDKVYENGFHAVHQLSLDVADGEFLVLVGPSGCGKSTALRMIAGLESISSGELRIGDKVVNDLEPKDRDIAMVFQSYALYPHLTVRNNIAFALKLRKMPKDEINERVEKAAKILELTENLDRRPGQLSGGQRQRVAMGRAIVRQPQAFLMDEPLSNLDAKLRVQMRAEVSKIQHSLNVTTVYVTHDQIEAMTMGDRVAVLSRGYLQQVDTPQNLYDHPDNLFVGAFIGSPQMNLLEATVSSNGDATTLRVGSNTLTVPASVMAAVPALAGYDGRRVAVGIRPEHLSAAADGAPDTIKGVIDVREGLGSEVILHMTTDAVGVDTSAAENSRRDVGPRRGRPRRAPHDGAGRRAGSARRRHQPHPPVRPRDRPLVAVAQLSPKLLGAGTGCERPSCQRRFRPFVDSSRRSSRRRADDEVERQLLDERDGPDPRRERTGQDVRAALPRRLERLADRGQAAVRGEVDVVVADDRHVAGHRLAGQARRLEDAERLDVGRGDDRRRWLGHGEQLGRELARGRTRRAGHASRTAAPSATPAAARAATKPSCTVAARHEAERVPLRLAYEGDALVTQRQQVLGRDPAAVAVVDDDARQRGVRRVDQHDRELRMREPVAFV